jgi:putative ATP-dependent endonuclease of the OLD family
MFISNIKLWNFRKYGSNDAINLNKPDLDLDLRPGLNVLIGENDSGKTAIIDAIKMVLKTHSYEWIRPVQDDFYREQTRFRIELRLKDISDDIGRHFTEWLGWEGTDETANPILRLIYDVSRQDNRILASDVKAGFDDEGYELTAEAKEYLKATYLKPLRDAENELVPKQNSRLSQILIGHEAFKDQDNHQLVLLLKEFNKCVENYFDGLDKDGNPLPDIKGKELKREIDKFLQAFYEFDKETNFSMAPTKLRNILEKLDLSLKDEINPGLGTLNRLFMSSELLHLHKQHWDGIRLGLVEELESHLHPQAQLRVIESLQSETDIQLIVTTHSPNLGSKVKLENLIICKDKNVFPMGSQYTGLHSTDYTFLERFLDTTKANLFFAKGTILVEGWAEEILLPALSRKMKKLGIIQKNLTEAGVSVVNVGNTAFLRYSNIFIRKQAPFMNIPVAIVSDLDDKPIEYCQSKEFADDLNKCMKKAQEKGKTDSQAKIKQTLMKKHKITPEFDSVNEKERKKAKYTGQSVKAFISPHWTLEYCIALSPKLCPILFQAIVMAGRELDADGQKGKIIRETWEEFSESQSNEQIAFNLYNQFIGDGKSLSKPIIAQHFSKLLEEDSELDSQDLTSDPNINYLVEAIKHAGQ